VDFHTEAGYTTTDGFWVFFFGLCPRCIGGLARSWNRASSIPDPLPWITAQKSFARPLADSSGYTAYAPRDSRRTAPAMLARRSPPDTSTNTPSTNSRLSFAVTPPALAIHLGCASIDHPVIRSVLVIFTHRNPHSSSPFPSLQLYLMTRPSAQRLI
jgi:hypothetical protein